MESHTINSHHIVTQIHKNITAYRSTELSKNRHIFSNY